MTCRCNELTTAAADRRVGEIIDYIAPAEPVIGTVVRDAYYQRWQRVSRRDGHTFWAGITVSVTGVAPLPLNWQQMLTRGPLVIVAVRPKLAGGEESPRNWLMEEIARARARNAELPDWARPVVTRPLRSKSEQLDEAFARARARSARLPDHARLVITRPLTARTLLTARRAYEENSAS